jgi:hypothetical protein
MYIEAVPNRNSPPAILLRESYRHEGKVRKRTQCNLSDWSPAHVEGLRCVLKGGTVIPAEQDAVTVTRRLLHGHVAAARHRAQDWSRSHPRPRLQTGRWPDAVARHCVFQP